ALKVWKSILKSVHAYPEFKTIMATHSQQFRVFILSLVGLFLGSTWASAQFDFVSRYNAETLEVRIFMGDIEEEIILIREEEGNIIFRPRSTRSGAEIGRPLDDIVDV